jgi:hypothetical protein
LLIQLANQHKAASNKAAAIKHPNITTANPMKKSLIAFLQKILEI